MVSWVIVILCLVVSIHFGETKQWFRKGRLTNGGFLGHLGRSPKSKLTETRDVEHWYTQKLDHFEPTDGRTWSQRYFINGLNYKEGGPVFLYIGGEGEVDPWFMHTGHMAEMSEKFHALCFVLEHRFYGKSHPTTNLERENMKFLNSNQALADLAGFRTWIGHRWNVSNAKWIAFGGSYPGNLAAWVRMKYPHLIHASVASSAPVRAKLNFKEYLEVVANSIKSFTSNGDQCLAAIASATRVIDKNLLYANGRNMLKDKFNICDPLDAYKHDIQVLYETLASNFMGLTQYDEAYFGTGSEIHLNLEKACQILQNKTYGLTAFDRYANLSSIFLKESESECLDVSYAHYLHYLGETDWETHEIDAGRQWTWQTCTEFGYYQTTDSDLQPFGNHVGLRLSLNDCKKTFGEGYSDDILSNRIEETNINYGEDDIKVSRVIFVNGNKDPWHVLGVLKNPSKSPYEVIVINGTSHCDDMRESRPSDPPQLKLARKQIEDVLSKWILAK